MWFSIRLASVMDDIYGWVGLRDRSNLNRRFFDANEDSFYGRSVCLNFASNYWTWLVNIRILRYQGICFGIKAIDASAELYSSYRTISIFDRMISRSNNSFRPRRILCDSN